MTPARRRPRRRKSLGHGSSSSRSALHSRWPCRTATAAFLLDIRPRLALAANRLKSRGGGPGRMSSRNARSRSDRATGDARQNATSSIHVPGSSAPRPAASRRHDAAREVVQIEAGAGNVRRIAATVATTSPGLSLPGKGINLPSLGRSVPAWRRRSLRRGSRSAGAAPGSRPGSPGLTKPIMRRPRRIRIVESHCQDVWQRLPAPLWSEVERFGALNRSTVNRSSPSSV